MKTKLLKLGLAAFALAAVLVIALPTILHKAGLHPEYTGETHQLPAGMRAVDCACRHARRGL